MSKGNPVRHKVWYAVKNFVLEEFDGLASQIFLGDILRRIEWDNNPRPNEVRNQILWVPL